MAEILIGVGWVWTKISCWEGAIKMLNGFGEGEAYNDLGAGSEADLSVSKQMNLIFVISGQK